MHMITAKQQKQTQKRIDDYLWIITIQMNAKSFNRFATQTIQLNINNNILWRHWCPLTILITHHTTKNIVLLLKDKMKVNRKMITAYFIHSAIQNI